MKVNYKIIKDFNNMSINDYFISYHLGKEKIKKLKVYVNDLEVKKDYLLKENDLLTLEYQDEIDFLPMKGKLKILYEDDYLLIVDKLPFLMVHPDDKTKSGCLVNMIANYYQKTKQNISVKYLHRIDTDTSGIVMIAKDILSASLLNYQISTHEVARVYLCIASGKFKEDKGRYEYKIADDRHVSNKKRVGPTGKPAITNYEVLKRLSKNLNLVKVQLETGRTHQIRVHFSYANHPLVGDKLYNGNVNLLNRQALHSWKVEFIHPITKELIKVEAPIPKDMDFIIKKHDKSNGKQV